VCVCVGGGGVCVWARLTFVARETSGLVMQVPFELTTTTWLPLLKLEISTGTMYQPRRQLGLFLGSVCRRASRRISPLFFDHGYPFAECEERDVCVYGTVRAG
jgi:hypothetical protein